MTTSLLFAVLFGCAALSGCSETGAPVRRAAWTFPPRAEASGNTGTRVRASLDEDPSGIHVQRISLDLRDRQVSYQMPMDSANPSRPLVPAPSWKPYSPAFKISGLNGTQGPGEWLLDWQPAATGTVRKTGLLLSSRLDAWGVVADGVGEVAVMIWSDPGGAPIATLLIRDIPETDWVAFAFYPGASDAAGSTLMFENLPETYWPSKGTLRRDAVANADGDFAYGREGMCWELDAVRFWALTHNLDSQQTAGVGYVVHPDDFARLSVNRGRGGVRTEIRPGVGCARFALVDFTGIAWTDALEAKRAEFPDALAFLDASGASARFRPCAQNRAQHGRLRMLMEDVRACGAEIDAADAEVLEAFLDGFRVFDTEGLDLQGVTEWLRLSNQVRRVEPMLSNVLLNQRAERSGE